MKYNNKIRKLMNSNELQYDNQWYEIMDAYIPDQDTTIEITQLPNLTLVILAVSYVENYNNYLSVYYGNNFFETFLKSGYLESLLEQDNDYLKYLFNKEQIKLIKEMRKSFF